MLEQIYGSPGYCLRSLSADDLEFFRSVIGNHYLKILYDAGIENYGNHVALFPKEKRLFSQWQVDVVKSMRFMHAIRTALGDFTVADIELPDGKTEPREEIYWRLVRPHEPSDVGQWHRDSDFHKAHGTHQDHMTVKCWIGVYVEPHCGLAVIPDSHVCAGGEELTLDCNAGTVVIFGHDLLHRGLLNVGTRARVSAEITLALDGGLPLLSHEGMIRNG
jgi:hypothetical protein